LNDAIKIHRESTKGVLWVLSPGNEPTHSLKQKKKKAPQGCGAKKPTQGGAWGGKGFLNSETKKWLASLLCVARPKGGHGIIQTAKKKQKGRELELSASRPAARGSCYQ